MTIDERLGALTQSVQFLALMHEDNERGMADNNQQLAEMVGVRDAVIRGIES